MDNVVVTGASRGIGLAVAARLAREGFCVTAVARKPSAALERAAADLQGAGALHFEPLDLSDIEAIPAFVRDLRAHRGPIYGLVNNAGVSTEGLLATMANTDIEALLRLNALSPMVLTKYVVRGMMAEGRGRIVNMASIVASTGFNGLSAYAATKAALVGFTKSLARELASRNITVNAVAPGFIETDMTRALPPAQRAAYLAQLPAGRFGLPEEIAAGVLFLASPEAAYMTGQTLHINGGMYMG